MHLKQICAVTVSELFLSYARVTTGKKKSFNKKPYLGDLMC